MSGLKKMNEELASAKSIKDALSLSFVKDTFIRNYQAITGRSDGHNRFMSEVFHYLEILNENDKLKNADRFSHFAAIVKAGTTGLSFGKEGQLYPIVYGTVVKVQIGAHGKRELLRRMPNLKFIGEGQVILKGDTFRHDKINNILLEHIASEKQPALTLENIIAAYVRLEFKDKPIDVVVYHEDIVKAKSKSKDKREDNTWNTWPSQMAVKVAYNRAYKLYYSVPQIEVSGVTGIESEEDDEEETQDIAHEVQPQPEPQEQQTQEAPKVVKKQPDDEDVEKYLANR